jgi:hypothetical protein
MDEIMKHEISSQVSTVPQHGGSGAMVESNRAVAEVQAMVLMAKRFPRDQKVATDNIMIECQRPGLAEQAIYSYARGGNQIQGPSIRVAEVLARNWGNIDAGVVELSRSNGQSEMMAYCVDLETNYRQRRVFTVEHIRSTKKGNYALSDSRDIAELLANQAARRLRGVILAVIPADIIEQAVNQCEATLAAKADTSPEALKKLLEAFAPLGITKEQIEKRIQRHLDTITPAQLISLRKIYNSLKDGMAVTTDFFEVQPEQQAAAADMPSGLKEKLKSAKAKIEAATTVAPDPVAAEPKTGKENEI